MMETGPDGPRTLDLKGSMAALKRAALRAREEAIRTHTNLIIAQDDKMVIITPEELQEPNAK